MAEDLEGRGAAGNPQDERASASFMDDVNQTRGQRGTGDMQLASANGGRDLYQWGPESQAGGGRDLYQWGPDSQFRNEVPITNRRQNQDGSVVEMGVAADGREHPIRIVYPDGRSTQYGYDRSGRVNEVANRNAYGGIDDHWMDRGGGRFVETRTNQTNEGVISVRADGSASFQGRGVTIENRTDGSLVTRFADREGRPHTVFRGADGGTVESVPMGDGQNAVIRVRFPNGNECTYDYDQNGRIYGVNEWGPGGPAGGILLLSFSTRDGQTWVENQGKAPNKYGDLQMTPDGQHVFRDAQDGTTFVRRPDGQMTIQDRNGQVIWGTPGTATPRQNRR